MSLIEKFKKFFLRKKSSLETLQQSDETLEKKTNIEENILERNNELGLIDEKFLYGYILKTLKSIEESLKRIEYNMVTKDWAALNLSEKKDIENLLNKLDEKIENIKFILPSASSALSRSSRSNEIIKKAVEIIRERKEISYEDLARELGISNSYLRAIASLIEMNNPNIKRNIRDKKGYFIYFEKID